MLRILLTLGPAVIIIKTGRGGGRQRWTVHKKKREENDNDDDDDDEYDDTCSIYEGGERSYNVIMQLLYGARLMRSINKYTVSCETDKRRAAAVKRETITNQKQFSLHFSHKNKNRHCLGRVFFFEFVSV